MALLQAAPEQQPRLYAHADEAYWPTSALKAVGLKPNSAYIPRSGKIPTLSFPVPMGFKLVALSEVSSLLERWQAQEGYSDLIGHAALGTQHWARSIGHAALGTQPLRRKPFCLMLLTLMIISAAWPTIH